MNAQGKKKSAHLICLFFNAISEPWAAMSTTSSATAREKEREREKLERMEGDFRQQFVLAREAVHAGVGALRTCSVVPPSWKKRKREVSLRKVFFEAHNIFLLESHGVNFSFSPPKK